LPASLSERDVRGRGGRTRAGARASNHPSGYGEPGGGCAHGALRPTGRSTVAQGPRQGANSRPARRMSMASRTHGAIRRAIAEAWGASEARCDPKQLCGVHLNWGWPLSDPVIETLLPGDRAFGRGGRTVAWSQAAQSRARAATGLALLQTAVSRVFRRTIGRICAERGSFPPGGAGPGICAARGATVIDGLQGRLRSLWGVALWPVVSHEAFLAAFSIGSLRPRRTWDRPVLSGPGPQDGSA
jgi:hypothetical protein